MKSIEKHKRQKTSVLDKSNNNYNLNPKNGANSPIYKSRDNIKLNDFLYHKKIIVIKIKIILILI
jgi:hypothetical protein